MCIRDSVSMDDIKKFSIEEMYYCKEKVYFSVKTKMKGGYNREVLLSYQVNKNLVLYEMCIRDSVEGGRLLSMKTMRMWRKRIPIIFCCVKSKKNFRRTIQMAVLVTRS